LLAHPEKGWVVDGILIFLLVSTLIWPLYTLKYLDNWASIESTFIADARMLGDPMAEGQWQPLWYCGTRSDYIYPPALRYGTEWIAKLIHSQPGNPKTARAYHLYTAFHYALGIVAVYLLIRTGSRSRGFAWIGAAAVALLSPVFAIIPIYRYDSVFHVPQRLHVLMQYGEGPHVSALCLLPFVFIAMLKARGEHTMPWLCAAAAACALVVSNNFYGATALAILFPILIWSRYVADRDGGVFLRALVVAALAYGLTAFWLIPSYLRVTSQNLKLVAEPGNAWSIIVLVIGIALFCGVTIRWRGLSAYSLFVWGGALFLSLYILAHRWLGFQVAGESHRLIPELDLFLILLWIEILRWLWNRKSRPVRIATVVSVAVVFSFAGSYLRHAWFPFPADRNWENRVEYKTAKWIQENAPSARVFVSGSIRFWLDTWANLSQMDGGSQQGLLNSNTVAAAYQMLHSDNPEVVLLWAQATAVDLAVVPDKASKEIYHDFSHPELWRANFPLLHDDGEGNAFYRIPRRSPGIVRVVNAGLAGSAPLASHLASLRSYVSAIEAPAANDSRVTYRRESSDAMVIDSTIREGEAILLQEAYDAAWRAVARTGQGESTVAIIKDPAGFMLLAAPAGSSQIRMEFRTPLEVHAGRLLTILSTGFILLSFVRANRRRFR
jgi:hypothetical protein